MNPVLQVNCLTHNYDATTALKGVDLNIHAGEFIALVGQNGCGKTTMAKHFNGLLKPSSGTVQVQGETTAKAKVSSLALKVGYVFQNPDHQIFNDTVEKEVSFGLRNIKMNPREIEARVEDALQQVNLLSYKKASPYDLSRGQRQRVAIASVLAMQPDILILDEPTTGQDHRESKQIMKILKELNNSGHTILFITHSMTLVAEFASRVILMDEGKIVIDKPVEEFFASLHKNPQRSVSLPPVTRLGYALGTGETWLTVDEAFQKIQSLMGGAQIGISH